MKKRLSASRSGPVPLRLYLFGALRIECARKPIRLPTRKIESLLAYLALSPGPHSREKLAALFWGDVPDSQARNSLRRALASLRQALGESALSTDRASIQLNPHKSFSIDAHEFMASPAHPGGSVPNAPAEIENLKSKIELYRGDLLQDFYDDWILQARTTYRERAIEYLLRLAQVLRGQSEYEQARTVAQRVLDLDPTIERAHQQLMFCYLMLGERANALKQYQECERLLRQELNAEPTPETTSLYRWIHHASIEHKSREAEITNLPIPLSSFIGRARETREIQELVTRTRLLTITGAGGIGKTRHAIQVGTNLIDSFRDGVWWVELAPVLEPGLLPQAIAKTLGVREELNRSLNETLIQWIQPRTLLLVLDNCEHLITASAALIEQLLRACPHLVILTTSREPLRIAGERVYQVPPLSQPEGREFMSLLTRYEAIQLFAERAVAVKPSFVLTQDNALDIAQICQRLDGIPLALELAAARTTSLSPAEISARLTDRFALLTEGSRTALPRQQTLRALIDWSYDLLSFPERILFRRLAVFVGGHTLQAAEEVCAGDGIVQGDVLRLLGDLVQKSLVTVDEKKGETRYHFLETIRQYALERLEASGEQEILQRRHANYSWQLVEQGYEGVRSSAQEQWLDHLEVEQENWRSALGWARDNGARELALGLAGALWLYWSLRGSLTEGRSWLEGLLNLFGWRVSGYQAHPPSDLVPSVYLARALHGAGWLAEFHADYPTSYAFCQVSVAMWRQLDNPIGLSRALNAFATAAFHKRDLAESRAAYEESLEIARTQDYSYGMSVTLVNLGELLQFQGEYAQAHKVFLQSLALSRQNGTPKNISGAIHHLAIGAQMQGDYATARRLFEESLAMRRGLNMKMEEASSLIRLGIVARAQGDYAAARAYSQESLVLYAEERHAAASGWCRHNLGQISIITGDIREAEAEFRASLELFEQAGNLKGCACALAGFGAIALAMDQPRRAAQLLAAAQMQLTLRAEVLAAPDLAEFERVSGAARASLGANAFQAAWKEGSAWSMEQAVRLALTTA